MITVSSEWTALGIPSIREMTKLSDLKEAGHAVEIEFRDSHLDDSAMAYLDQRVPADAIVTVTAERGYLFKYASETK